MWWDSTQITALDAFFFSLFIISISYVFGYIFVKMLSHFNEAHDPFASLDLIQKINFRILFGFTFINFLFVFFPFFSLPFFSCTLLIILIIGLGIVISLFYSKVEWPKKLHYKKHMLEIGIFAVFLSSIFFSSLLIAGYFGSTNDDGADHTLMTRIVLDNPEVLVTHSGGQYANFLIRYPLGTHILSAFFLTTLAVPIQKIIILMSAVFPALIALSFYSTIKLLFNNKGLSILGLIIAAFFTMNMSSFPISWGGLPLLLSYFITISGIGLIFLFILKEPITWLNAFILGLIFFIASRTYPVALLIISFWFLLVLSVKFLSQFSKNRQLSLRNFLHMKNLIIGLSFFIPVLMALPYFYAILTNDFSAVQGHLINIVSSWVEPVKASIAFNWIVDIPAFMSYFSQFSLVLALAPLTAFLLVGLTIPKFSHRFTSFFAMKDFHRSLLLVYVFVLIILVYLTLTLFIPIDFFTSLFDPARVWQYTYLPGTILTAVVIFSIFRLVYLIFNRLYHYENPIVRGQRKLVWNRVLACGMVALLIISMGFTIIPIITEQQKVYGNIRATFSNFESLGSDDISLMCWINENIPLNDNILVSSGDSGQFLAAVTQHHSISVNNRLANYSDLIEYLTANSSDVHAVNLMLKYNVSYVYVGSIATKNYLEIPYYRSFDITNLMSSPYFTLTKEIGTAYLFKFNSTAVLSY
jgi:hypothetical protein